MTEAIQSDDWKSKYRDLLAELESKENDWSKAEDALRGLASRLAIAAMGRTARIDQHLNLILDVIKGRVTDKLLDKELEGLSAAVLEHEHQREEQDELDLSPFVAQLHLSPADQKRHLDALDDPQAARRMEALSNLAAELNATLGAPRTEPTAPLDTMQEILGTLIYHLRDIPELSGAVDDLKARLAEDLSPDALDELLSNLATAVNHTIDAINQDREELESFLETVTRQLAQFEAWSRDTESDAEARRGDAESLERNVEQQVGGLRGELEASGDISDLKQRLQTRIDSIAEQFRAFRKTEEMRASEASKRNALLLEEINQLKVRTGELAERCRHQEHRLMHDALTGVYSRYAYEQRLQEEFQRWSRHGQPLCYSIWDIDHFKHVNDNFGHQTGDRLLAVVAKLLSDSTRGEDFVARIGGEEFIVLFPATQLDMASELTDRLREKVADVRFHYKGTPIIVTISCGITEFRPGDTPETVYKRADKALYDSKTAGRNRCTTA